MGSWQYWRVTRSSHAIATLSAVKEGAAEFKILKTWDMRVQPAISSSSSWLPAAPA
jgi:hypothetical protein